MKKEEQQESLRDGDTSSNQVGWGKNVSIPPPSQLMETRTRHIYLEEENTYGRFVPYLLLHDQLTSEIDSSGNTALHHMCSHNSPYLPLYLSTLPKNAPILNRKNKTGHTPLDVAALYCNRKTIQLLQDKGAIDNENIDCWAIQGGNIQNWSGNVSRSRQKQFLIHWAAYNDMPDVLQQFSRVGVDLSVEDPNGFSPIDLTVLNKSYRSFHLLLKLNLKPKSDIIEKCDSKSMLKLLKQSQRSSLSVKLQEKLKLFFLLFFCILNNLVSTSVWTIVFSILTIIFQLVLYCQTPQRDPYLSDNRTTSFKSQLLGNITINIRNYPQYLLLHLFVIAMSISTLLGFLSSHTFFFMLVFAIMFFFFVHFCILMYGILRNLTYSEMFYANKWPHLWQKIKYIEERCIVMRQFDNPYDRGCWQNLKQFFCPLT